MKTEVRVGVVSRRSEGFGGLQTCFLELVVGLNEMGIEPDVLWDEQQDWHVLGSPAVRSGHRQAVLGVSSARMRRLPQWLGNRLRPMSIRRGRFGLERYDFVYSFEPGVRMPAGKGNVCFTCGPPLVRTPDCRMSWRDLTSATGILRGLGIATAPLVRPDVNTHYVTLSEWIADLIEARYGFRPPVIWPPARTRGLPPERPERSGFLFLSRLEAYKRADAMLAVAKALPGERVTIAGGLPDPEFVRQLRAAIEEQGVKNAQVLVSPSESVVAQLLVEHAYFVFPAPWEHFGLSTVEAIHAGQLPLVHNSGGQKEIVPFAELRFDSDEDLVKCAVRAAEMPRTEKKALVEALQVHCRRGTSERFRAEMLRPLRDLLRERGLLPKD